MKILLSACTALVIGGFTALKAQNSNNLIVFSESGDRFYLILNGIKYNQVSETNVKVTNLNAPNYRARIVFEKAGIPDLNQNVFLMWEGNETTNKEFTYVIQRKADKYKLRMLSQADIGANNNSDGVVYNSSGTLLSNGGVNIASDANGGGYNTATTVTTTSTTSSGGQGETMGMNINMDGVNMNISVSGTGANPGKNTSVNTTVTTATTTTSYSSSSTYTSSGHGHNHNTGHNTSGYTGPGACYSPMSQSNFNDLTSSINAKAFEDAKLKVARQAISSNCVSAAQVRKLMDLFTFEDNKLQLAKYSYDYTVDKQNYFKVNDGFTFDSSVDALNEYISSKK
jgi:hypothetical protein